MPAQGVLSRPLRELIAKRQELPHAKSAEGLLYESYGEEEYRQRLEEVATRNPDLFLVLHAVLRGENPPAPERKEASLAQPRETSRGLTEAYSTLRAGDSWRFAFCFPELHEARLLSLKQCLRDSLLGKLLTEEVGAFAHQLSQFLTTELPPPEEQQMASQAREWRAVIEGFIQRYYHAGSTVEQTGCWGGYLEASFSSTNRTSQDTHSKLYSIQKAKIIENFPEFIQDKELLDTWVDHFDIRFKARAEKFKEIFFQSESLASWKAEFEKEFSVANENQAQAQQALLSWNTKIKKLQGQLFPASGKVWLSWCEWEAQLRYQAKLDPLALAPGEECSLAELAIRLREWESLLVLDHVAQVRNQKLVTTSAWARGQQEKALIETLKKIQTLYLPPPIPRPPLPEVPREVGGNEREDLPVPAYPLPIPVPGEHGASGALTPLVRPESVQDELKRALGAWGSTMPLYERLAYFPEALITPSQVENLVGRALGVCIADGVAQMGNWQALAGLKKLGVISEADQKHALRTAHPVTGNTCLHYCVRARDVEGIEYCLTHEADGIAQNAHEERPFEVKLSDRDAPFLAWLWRDSGKEEGERKRIFQLCIEVGQANPFFFLPTGQPFLSSLQQKEREHLGLLSFRYFTVESYLDLARSRYRQLKEEIGTNPDWRDKCGIKEFDQMIKHLEKYRLILIKNLQGRLRNLKKKLGLKDVVAERFLEMDQYLSAAGEAFRTGDITKLMDRVVKINQERKSYHFWQGYSRDPILKILLKLLRLKKGRHHEKSDLHKTMLACQKGFEPQREQFKAAFEAFGLFKKGQEDLQKKVEEANLRAAAAEADAAEAKAESATAMAAAQASQDKAEVAESKAEVAESKAKAAESKAEVAESKAKAAESKAEVAESKAKAAESKAEAVESKVKAAEASAASAIEDAKALREEWQAFKAGFSPGSSSAE